MEVVYSNQRANFERGRHYQNPLYFDRVTPGVSHVYIMGNWPIVKAAYEAAGVPVTQMRKGASFTFKDGLAPAVGIDIPEGKNYVQVEILSTYKQFGTPRLIQLAKDIAGTDKIPDRKKAIRVIENEIEYRRQQDLADIKI